MIETKYRCDICEDEKTNLNAYRIKFGPDWELCEVFDNRASDVIVCTNCLRELVAAKNRAEK